MELKESYTLRVLSTLVIAQILGGVTQGVAFSMSALLAAKMAGQQWGGMSATLSTLGAALWALVLARVVVRFGRRAALTVGMFLGMLGAAAVLIAAQISSFPLLLVGFVLIGGGTAVGFQVRFVAADVSPVATRGRNLSLIMWATTIGAVIGPNLFNVAESLGDALGLAEHSGSYVISLAAQLVAVIALQVGLRPDPMGAVGAVRAGGVGKKKAKEDQPRLTEQSDHGAPLTGRRLIVAAIGVIAIGHFLMVSIMAMTPVHLEGHGASLTMIGITISAHVAGMYALSPLFGILADRWGRYAVIVLGWAMQGISALLLIVAPGNSVATIVSLILLGTGWSAIVIAGSALLVDATPDPERPRIQGRSDFFMNIAGAGGGALAGPIVGFLGMPTIGMIAIGMLGVSAAVLAWGRRAETREV